MNAYFVYYFFESSQTNQKGVQLQKYCRRFYGMLIEGTYANTMLHALVCAKVRLLNAAYPKTKPFKVEFTASQVGGTGAQIVVYPEGNAEQNVVRLWTMKVMSRVTDDGLERRRDLLLKEGGEA